MLGCSHCAVCCEVLVMKSAEPVQVPVYLIGVVRVLLSVIVCGVIFSSAVVKAIITHTTAATLMAVVLRLLFHPEGCLRTMDSPLQA